VPKLGETVAVSDFGRPLDFSSSLVKTTAKTAPTAYLDTGGAVCGQKTSRPGHMASPVPSDALVQLAGARSFFKFSLIFARSPPRTAPNDEIGLFLHHLITRIRISPPGLSPAHARARTSTSRAAHADPAAPARPVQPTSHHMARSSTH
jgi:hypothetical protein